MRFKILSVLVQFLLPFFASGSDSKDVNLPRVLPMMNVTAVVGTEAILTCSVTDLYFNVVGWIRMRDSAILALGEFLYTQDSRLQVTHENDSLTWRLHIRNVKPSDSGLYQCQLSTTPNVNYQMSFLQVVEESEVTSLSPLLPGPTETDANVDETTQHPPLEYSTECGGLISVPPNGTNLTYRNPEGVKTCIWVISNGPVGLTLTKDETLSSEGHPGRGTLTLQTQFLHLVSTTPRLIEEDGIEVISENKVTVIVFSSSEGQKLHLGLRLSQSGSMNLLDPLKVNLDFMKQKKNSNGSTKKLKYSYPALPDQLYSGQEHRLVLLQPFSGSKVTLKVDHVDTEQNIDHLNVFQFSAVEKRFIFLQRFTGNLGPVEDSAFNGIKGQPVLLYLKTFGDTHGTGFKITYSYEAVSEIDPTTDKSEIRTFPGSNCGGLITLSKFNDLTYTNSKNVTEICIWGFWTVFGRHIGFTFDLLPDLSDSIGASLSLQRKFRGDSSTVGRVIQNGDRGKEIIQTEAFILLVFKALPGQGFHLNFREIIRPKKGNYTLNLHLIEPQPEGIESTFAYSLTPLWAGSQITFTGYDYRFLIFKAVPGQKLHLTVDYVRTSAPSDRLSVFSYSKDAHEFSFLGKFSGNLGHLQNVTFEGNEGQPVLIYFRVDPSVPTNGFNISYSYKVSEGIQLDPFTVLELQDDLCPLLNPTILVNHWPIGDIFSGRMVYAAGAGNSTEDCARSCCMQDQSSSVLKCNYAILTGSVCYMLTCDKSTPDLCDPVELAEEDRKTANINLVLVRPLSPPPQLIEHPEI